MASPAQFIANRQNARLSTGPRTHEGKAAVAQNRTSHGLAGAFCVLPCEDQSAFDTLRAALLEEYGPKSPTEFLLVEEIARGQWRMQRTDRIEAELLATAPDPAWFDIVAQFRDATGFDRLARYSAAARRNFYRALSAYKVASSRSFEAALAHAISPAALAAERHQEICSSATPSNPMPEHLQLELEGHLRRDPLFSPVFDASQMSGALRRWYERNKM